jgi:anti-sigma factor RsiW
MSDIETLLVAYADGELGTGEAEAVERILADDPRARRSLEIYRETTALLRAACAESNYATPLTTPVRRSPIWQRPAMAMAASIAVLLLGYGGGFYSAPRPPSFVDDVAEYHEVFSRETTHLAELPAAQSDEINRWLGGHLERKVVAPDLSSEGLSFAGARMWISEGAPVADLLYTRALGLPVALCIVRANDTAAATPIRLDRRGMLEVASWRRDGYDFAIVGELSPAEVHVLADKAEAQTRG